MQTFTYQQFEGSCEFSQKDLCHHGNILFIQDLVTYKAETVPELEKAFQASVDDYLDTLSLLQSKTQKTGNCCASSVKQKPNPTDSLWFLWRR